MLSEKIIFLQKRDKINQQELADIIGMTKNGFQLALKNNEFKASILKKIADVFKVSVDFLLDDNQAILGSLLKIDGKKNKTIQGDGNVLGNKARENLLNTSLLPTADGKAVLEERIKNLEGIIKEKDKQLEEKERTIQILMKK